MIAAGHLIGNYRILSKIGTGGMGAVYLAEHPLIGKKVALKVIHRELSGNKEVVSRFFQEARAVNQIGNEHIVEIHDFGVSPEGDHFYIMEYLEGRTLASVLTHETALDVMRALHIGAQIASALAAAHASGIIHRDLKPDNIMQMNRLGDPDFVKVLDFGLAKVFASGPSAVQTAVGVLLGTPQYMSPEACESKQQVDHRTDIYALGVLLFQMMTGVLPFDGESMGEILVKQVTALPPAPRGLNPAIPPAVEQLLLRCLAKHPESRFQTMMALRDALLDPEAYLRGSPPIAPARSVAPGEAKVDARQVLAAAEARTRMMTAGMAAQQPGNSRTMIDGAYTAPSKSKQIPVPALAPPQEPKMNTMRIATPHGYSSRPPRRVWPIVLVVGLLLGLGGGAFAVAWFGRGDGTGSGSDDTTSAGAGTASEGSADDGSAAVTTGSAASGSASTGSAASGSASTGSASVASGSAASGSAASSSAGSASTGSAGTGSAGTGSAGTGSGSARVTSSDGSGRGSGGSASAGSGAGSASRPGGGSGSAMAAGSGAGSAHVVPGSLAKLTLESQPTGASVVSPDGKVLGKTPLKIEWPTSTKPTTFVFKLRGYRDKPLELTVTSNTMSRVDLVRIPSAHPNPGRGSGTGRGSDHNDTGLIRPD